MYKPKSKISCMEFAKMAVQLENKLLIVALKG